MKSIKLISLGIAMLISFLTFGQQTTITGTVTDANGPLPGVNVVVKYTQRGVSTDIYGNYSIKVTKGEVLVFTFMGMCEETRPVTDLGNINIIMQEEPLSLEMVTTPHHAIKKRTDQLSVYGKTVTAEEIQLKPKQDTKGYICRVSRTIQKYKEPLIVIDGKIASQATLKLIAPEKINSVNVLKGAQATALYGSYGTNGVVLITTKDLTLKEIRKLKKQSKIESLKDQD